MWVLLVILLVSIGQIQACEHQGQNCTEPKCSETCLNGTCVAPGECQCFSGYQFINGSRTACGPICSMDCGLNARCTAPETCACNEGFNRNSSSNDCKPLCSRRCNNGICSSPNKCTCLEGYGELLWYWCIPLCPKPCIHGNCVEPGKCRCFTGYQPSSIQESNICEPICSQGCGHGRCIAPEICHCDKGYAKRSTEGSCELREGFDIITESKCSHSSNNGTCEEPNTEAKRQLLSNSDTETETDIDSHSDTNRDTDPHN